MSVLLRIASLLLLCCFPVGAMAQSNEAGVEIGVGIVCNTAQQIERFVALQTGGSEAHTAVQLINGEAHDGSACGVVAVAFIARAKVRDVAVSGGAMRVTEVTIVGAMTERGLMAIEPFTQYTAFFVKFEEA